MGVAGTDATPPKAVQDGGRIDAQVFSDPCERPAETVEMDGGVDLLGGEAAAAHQHVMPTKDGADCPSVNAELRTQLVHRRSGSVAGDKFLDLVGVELPCPSGFGPIDGWWNRCCGVG